MGDRGQVKVEGVYLYTHWGATDLVQDVKTALAKEWRWDDHEYLARIIFDVMTGDSQGEETGMGIGTIEHGDIWRLIEITKDSQIIVKDNDEEKFRGDFKKFIVWADQHDVEEEI